MATEERTKEILKALHDSVYDFEEDDAVKWAKISIEEGVDPFSATMDGLAAGMNY
jgi:methanogenic corrinoid protein MtbC1